MMRFDRRKKASVKIPDDPEKAYAKALKTAFNILSYRDNTEKQLRDKLTGRGYSENTVDDVIEKVKQMGYLNEERMMYGMVRSFAVYKHYGKARIKRELSLKDFARDVTDSLDFDSDELCDIDFGEICYELLKKRGGVNDEKTYAFLIRHGHSSSDIRAAYKRLKEESEKEDI